METKTKTATDNLIAYYDLENKLKIATIIILWSIYKNNTELLTPTLITNPTIIKNISQKLPHPNTWLQSISQQNIKLNKNLLPDIFNTFWTINTHKYLIQYTTKKNKEPNLQQFTQTYLQQIFNTKSDTEFPPHFLKPYLNILTNFIDPLYKEYYQQPLYEIQD
jgi:hypothetical protein